MSKPGHLLSIIRNKCPRCRKGDLFTTRNPYRLGKLYSMPENCPVCGQKIRLYRDFWYIANYISYALCALTSLISLILYWVIIGITWRDNSLFHWMIFNAILVALLIPLYFRLARTIYLGHYVKYEPNIKEINGKVETTA